jgi:hypothetical protein
MADLSDPLPYVICFAVLFIISLGLLSWSLGVYNKSVQCVFNPNLWCSDNWQCEVQCSCANATGSTGSTPQCLTVNQCFNGGYTATGLASCLFGPTAMGATTCLPPTGPTGDSSLLACPCIDPMTQTFNCFSGCPIGLTGITGLYAGGCCNCTGPDCTYPCTT